MTKRHESPIHSRGEIHPDVSELTKRPAHPFSARAFPAAFTAIALTLLSACAVGPKYVRPAVEALPTYKESAPPAGGTSAAAGPVWKASQPADGAPRGNWWESFHDPRLNDLETRLNASNQNIAAASAAVLAARAIIRQSRSQYSPTITTGPSITNSHLSTFGPKPAGVTYSEFSLPFEASWEPDLFSRVRNTVSANTLAAQASVADLENIRLSAEADLATDYYELRTQDELKRLLDSTVAAYREALALNRTLSDSGLSSDEAVAQAETQLDAAEAQDSNLAILRAQYEHANHSERPGKNG
jgi:outer membrane protein TolC